jgi:hypothetical protein
MKESGHFNGPISPRSSRLTQDQSESDRVLRALA